MSFIEYMEEEKMNREVAVKTLIGKGRQYLVKEVNLQVNTKPSKALGCWIINHQYVPYNKDNELFIKGSYDIELWMAVEDDKKTEVYRTTIEFEEKVNAAFKNLLTLDDKMYLKPIVLHYPSCTKMELGEDKNVIVTIESEYLIDVFAEAILIVKCADNEKADLTLDEEILMNVNPDYMKIAKK